MKLKHGLALLGATVSMLLTSCSPFSLINSEVYNNAHLADYHTFRIVTPDDEHSLPPGMEKVTYYNIAAAIREQMVERGYTEDPQSPIVINIGITVKKEIATEPVAALAPVVTPPPPMPPYGPPPGPVPPGAHWYPYPGPGPAPVYAPYFMMPRQWYWTNPNAQVITGIYKEGVLTMDIVDMSTMKALYSSSVGTILENGDSQFRNLKGISEAVQTLFQKFPVKVLPQYRNQK